MARIRKRHPGYAQMQAVGRVLATGPRLDILRILADGPRTAKDISNELNRKTVRQHLGALRTAGILIRDDDGYALSETVDLVSTTKQHIFTFKFGGSMQMTLGLNVWDR